MKKFVTTLLAGTIVLSPTSDLEMNKLANGIEQPIIEEVDNPLIVDLNLSTYRTMHYNLDLSTFEELTYEMELGGIAEDTAIVQEEKYSAFYIVHTPLNKRKTPNLDFEPIGYLTEGEPVEGINRLENGWVELSDGSYVNGKYIIEQPGMTPEQYDDRVAIFEEEQAKILAEKKRQAELIRQKAIERHVAQANLKKAQVSNAGQVASTQQSVGRDGISISQADRDLLARLVRAEAGGESYEGMVAVASVVFNRMNSGQFPSTVSGVVYARNQFSPVTNGSINKPASDIHFQAVDDALTRDNTNGALFFYAPALVKSSYMETLKTVAVIGSHHFKVKYQ